MCRWFVYVGPTLLLADIITKPKHSIISQVHEHYLPDTMQNFTLNNLLNTSMRNHLFNGDGFGMGWYNLEVNDHPCVFTIATPPWNSRNLFRLCEHISSRVVFAHIRAATFGSVAELNCHPFTFGRLLWMHNGGIANFSLHRIKFLHRLGEKAAMKIQGTTDTEHAGAYFTTQLPGGDADALHTPEDLQTAMVATIRFIIDLVRRNDQKWLSSQSKLLSPSEVSSSLNFAVTDGHTTIATRFRNHPLDQPPSLYYRKGAEFRCVNGEFVAVDRPDAHCNPCPQTGGPAVDSLTGQEPEQACIIASEPLTYEKDKWKLVPKNHMVIVTRGVCVKIVPLYVGGPVDWCFQRWKEKVLGVAKLGKSPSIRSRAPSLSMVTSPSLRSRTLSLSTTAISPPSLKSRTASTMSTVTSPSRQISTTNTTPTTPTIAATTTVPTLADVAAVVVSDNVK
eukprot:TRINITY_DN12167_c0_g1_i5.p1 TRINITY_DN12167_c0_g1~~TRINITY_DN12167_c0_g1_i5.p1  ORF type:complete len:450 (+),score=41.87 TRINITY_DN12167_c0_g1_i5:23-1372(+)